MATEREIWVSLAERFAISLICVCLPDGRTNGFPFRDFSIISFDIIFVFKSSFFSFFIFLFYCLIIK